MIKVSIRNPTYRKGSEPEEYSTRTAECLAVLEVHSNIKLINFREELLLKCVEAKIEGVDTKCGRVFNAPTSNQANVVPVRTTALLEMLLEKGKGKGKKTVVPQFSIGAKSTKGVVSQ
jgi:hypothetical protein